MSKAESDRLIKHHLSVEGESVSVRPGFRCQLHVPDVPCEDPLGDLSATRGPSRSSAAWVRILPSKAGRVRQTPTDFYFSRNDARPSFESLGLVTIEPV